MALDFDRVDLVVCGTGLPESLVASAPTCASAAARGGKKVLHLDRNQYYGGNYATFNLTELETLVQDANRGPVTPAPGAADRLQSDGERLIFLADADATRALLLEFSGFVLRTHVPSQTVDAMRRAARQFSLDLAPQMLYARGPLVDLLVATDVGRYLEFKALERTFVHVNGAWERVPASKEDVFQSQLVGVVEKRILVKFLTFCLDYRNQLPEYQGFEQRPFAEFLVHKRIPPLLRDILVYAIALAPSDQIPTEEALERIHRYVSSLGRFSETPFIVPQYGASELSQAFCRAAIGAAARRSAAIYGGTYILGTCPTQVEFSTAAADAPAGSSARVLKPTAVVLPDGQRIATDALVGGPTYFPLAALEGGNADMFDVETVPVARMALIVDATTPSLFPETDLALGTVPPGALGNTAAVSILQCTGGLRVCPDAYRLVYLSTAGPLSDVAAVAHALFDVADPSAEPAPAPASESTSAAAPNGATSAAPPPPPPPPPSRGRVLWSLQYVQHVPRRAASGSPAAQPALFVPSGPSAGWDSEAQVDEARAWFQVCYPTLDFRSGDRPARDVDDEPAEDAVDAPSGDAAPGGDAEGNAGAPLESAPEPEATA